MDADRQTGRLTQAHTQIEETRPIFYAVAGWKGGPAPVSP